MLFADDVIDFEAEVSVDLLNVAVLATPLGTINDEPSKLGRNVCFTHPGCGSARAPWPTA